LKIAGFAPFLAECRLVFPHKDGGGFNMMLQAFPLDGKIVCREIADEDRDDAPPAQPQRSLLHVFNMQEFQKMVEWGELVNLRERPVTT
jgi:hypothetical protein